MVRKICLCKYIFSNNLLFGVVGIEDNYQSLKLKIMYILSAYSAGTKNKLLEFSDRISSLLAKMQSHTAIGPLLRRVVIGTDYKHFPVL